MRRMRYMGRLKCGACLVAGGLLVAACVLPGCSRRHERPLRVRFERPDRPPVQEQQWAWPVDRETGVLTSGFGYRQNPLGGRGKMHNGIDLAAPAGTTVRAARRGTVCFRGWQRGYGLTLILDHGRGLQSLYGHLRKVLVHDGAPVRRGAPIGEVGETGNATGPHLHFELRRNGKAFDPAPSLP